MATKKTAKSSKTAHVLNVLSGSPEDASSEELSGISPVLPFASPILEDARTKDQSLTGTIHDALAQELADEGEEALEEMPAAAPQEAPPTPAPKPASQKKEAPAPEPAPVPITPDASKLSSLAATELPGDIVYVNIMQALVEEKVPKFVEMFGLCTCSRCMADVKAIALSNLPPRYLVMPKGAFVPMLTVYERQYLTALTAQIISACKKVLDTPRH